MWGKTKKINGTACVKKVYILYLLILQIKSNIIRGSRIWGLDGEIGCHEIELLTQIHCFITWDYILLGQNRENVEVG